MTRTVLNKPPKAHKVSPLQLEAFNALVHVYGRDGRATYRTVATHLGCSVGTAHKRLRWLQRIGMVGSWPGHHGTLRPAVNVVAVFD